MTTDHYFRDLFRSALIAGLIAAFIWMVITVLAGGFGTGAIVGGGFAFLVGTGIVTGVIASLVGKAHERHS